MRRAFAALASIAALILTAGFAPPSALDQAAEAYVKLVLRVAQHDKDYLDAWFGPEAWMAQAKADPRSVEQLRADASDLAGRLANMDAAPLSGPDRARRAFLLSQLGAVSVKTGVMLGSRPRYREEAEGLYGVRPELKPISVFDPALAEVERLIPGDGALHERVSAYRARFAVPKDRLEAVVRAAVAECRRRTAEHIPLPAGEGVSIEMVSGKPWAAYNWYKGGGRSLIQVNTDYPLQVERVLELGCHEAYPGHHLHNTLLDRRLVRERGWVEFQVYPLATPFFFLAEGIGDYVPELVFPPAERVAFAREILFPLAGLDPAEADRYFALSRAAKRLSGASMTITADYVDGGIDREAAVRLTQKYALLSRQQAEASVDLMPKFRSYGVNYGLGRELVRAHVERAGPDPAARWRALERLLSEPVVPADLWR